jgi:hypothetical protein
VLLPAKAAENRRTPESGLQRKREYVLYTLHMKPYPAPETEEMPVIDGMDY